MASGPKPGTYQRALEKLESLQSNADVLRQSQEQRRDPALHVPQVASYLKRVGLEAGEVASLPVLHIAGTKGKGSTGAFAESILREFGYKTGFFNSPHLIEDRERIRLNGRPIDEDAFASYFCHVFDKLDETKESHDGDMPFYFSFFTVMALFVFVREKVDVAILEVGIGGQYDSTNVVRTPRVCGITSLDLDHTSILGNTLEAIAWQKAGIFKPGVPAFTVDQHNDSVMSVLLNRSKEIQCPLFVAPGLSTEEIGGRGGEGENRQLGIAGDRHLYNAALALQMCRVFRRQDADIQRQQQDVTDVSNIPRIHGTRLTTEEIAGLRKCYWPGRSHIIERGDVTFYLDGAHTPDSIQFCIRWFEEAASTKHAALGVGRAGVSRALVFNVTGKRDVGSLLVNLKDCHFDLAAFCPNKPVSNDDEVIPGEILSNQTEWDRLAAGTQCVSNSFASVDSALKWVTDRDVRKRKPAEVLITGSLYLVGATLKILSPCLYD